MPRSRTRHRDPTHDWNGTVANMFARLGVSAADDERAVATYLTAHFGSD